ncbi:hypothetical protein [Kaarinaea lacus]
MVDPDLAFFAYTFDGRFLGEFTNAVSQYEHEHIEGPYRASWTFEEGEEGASASDLQSWFNSNLMCQISVRYKGAQCWRGYVWEMELFQGKTLRNKSMNDFANAVAIKNPEYSEDEGNDAWIDFENADVDFDPLATMWHLNNISINEYGRMEEVLSSNGSDGEALKYAISYLERASEPFSPSVVFKPAVDNNTLRVSAVGNMVIANKVQLLDDQLRYLPGYDVDNDKYYGLEHGSEIDVLGTVWTVSKEIQRIVDVIDYHTGWLHAVSISTQNDTPTRAGSQNVTAAFDRLLELALITDSLDRRYHFRILDDGGVIYQLFTEDREVFYHLTTAEEGVRNKNGTTPTWDARPGLIKAIAGSAGPTLPNTWLSNRNLIPVERVSMRDGDEVASFHGRKEDVGDVYRAIGANRNWLHADDSERLHDEL